MSELWGTFSSFWLKLSIQNKQDQLWKADDSASYISPRIDLS